jgi:predicted dehydrogenase
VLRIGVLGAAAIAPTAIVEPARERPDVEIVAIAARDPRRARAFATEHGIPSVEDGYAAVVERPDVDVVYVPLPASLHREWCERALRNGKHVLCEKPLTTTLADTQELVTLAGERGLLLAEAFHYRHHPLMLRLRELVSHGEIGTPTAVVATVAAPTAARDVYRDSRLGGGAVLHNGCYAIDCIRTLLGAEGEVVSASAAWFDPPGADAEVEAQLAFPGGARGVVRASFIAQRAETSVDVIGSEGEIHCANFVAPHANGSIEVFTTAERRRETFPIRSSYSYQLDAIVDAIATGGMVATAGVDAVGNARTIDAILKRARAS